MTGVRRAAAALAAVGLVLAAGLGPAAPAAAAPKAGPGQWYLHEYGIDAMWKTTRGAGVTVAVIDSGISADHEDLKGTVVGAKDFSGARKDGRTPVGPASAIGHATGVAGVIAGRGVGEGPTGVAPEATLLSASMWLGGSPPSGADSSREQAAKAVRWAVDSGAGVINMSLGWDDPAWPEAWDSAFEYAFSKDVVVVACVGNRSEGAKRVWSPATVPGVVGVGGLTKSGRVASGSTAPGSAVSLMGPAQQIPVPYYKGGYAEASGCSFASPIVSGAAALLRAAHPDWSADEVVGRLEGTARAVKGHSGRTKGEQRDATVGYGRIDPPAALAAKAPAQPPNARRELADWVSMHRRAEPDGGAKGGASASASASQGASAAPAQAAAAPRTVAGPAVLIVCMLVAGGLVAYGIAAGVRARRLRRH